MILAKINKTIKKINLLNENERRLTFVVTVVIISALFYFPFVLPVTVIIKEYRSLLADNELIRLKTEKTNLLVLSQNNPNDKIKEKIIDKKRSLENIQNEQNKNNIISKVDIVEILKKTENDFKNLHIEKISFLPSSAVSNADQNYFKHTVEISLTGNYGSFKLYLNKIKNDLHLSMDQILIKSNSQNNYNFILSKIDEYKEWK